MVMEFHITVPHSCPVLSLELILHKVKFYFGSKAEEMYGCVEVKEHESLILRKIRRETC